MPSCCINFVIFFIEQCENISILSSLLQSNLSFLRYHLIRHHPDLCHKIRQDQMSTYHHHLLTNTINVVAIFNLGTIKYRDLPSIKLRYAFVGIYHNHSIMPYIIDVDEKIIHPRVTNIPSFLSSIFSFYSHYFFSSLARKAQSSP